MSAAAPAASGADVLRVGCYPTAKSLPLRIGIEKGFFAACGLDVSLSYENNSRLQRDRLASGDFDVIHIAVDNAVSMLEEDGLDVVVVLGGDSGMNEFFVQPDIDGFAGIRGRRVVVDAVDTAYALQAVKILADHGLAAGRDYTLDPVGRGALRLEAMQADPSAAAAVLNPPYSLEAEDLGFRSLGRTVELLGGYQAGGAFVLRDWARANEDRLVRYLAAYLEALRWMRLPGNRAHCVGVLCEQLQLSADVAARSLAQLLDPDFGFAADAEIDPAGFEKVLELRRMTASTPARTPARAASGDMIDLRYYRMALARLSPPSAEPTTNRQNGI
ncbi:ABC transporter substrate-binding protein [Jiella sonneratiae]|uniref:ABC transporter substrate-binding protein n=1 Tax=Jiella sonneratiae TaxID=2816856 RepID=UPI001A93F13F